MGAWTTLICTTSALFAAFALWWRWGLPRALARVGGDRPSLEDFHRVVARPFGLLYISNFLLHLGVAWGVPHPWTSPWVQFLVFGLGSIFATYAFQVCLVYPWHKRLAGTDLAPFLRSLLAYLRLTAALLAPFFIYQLLNATLFDPPAGRIDAVEVVVFNAGRLVILSLLTLVFSVMFMLRMIPNSPVAEEEYLELIGKRLRQAGWEGVRLRWIDIPDFNNAFVVGFKWFGFSNQTMFIGRSLRDLLSRDEFEAVISHELGHMANGHLLKRITAALTLLLGLVVSLAASLALSILVTLSVSDDPRTIAVVFGGCLLATLVGSYLVLVTWLFRLYRQQEHEADAFAVMQLGIRLEDLENSLRKVARKFREDARRRSVWNPFSTHPEIETRIENVRLKIDRGVRYDWNPSTLSRLLEMTVRVASPRALAMGFTLFVLTGLLTHSQVQLNRGYLAMVEKGDLRALESYQHHSSRVNARQYLLFGVTPLEMAVHRADMATVKFLISKGADPARGSGFSTPLDVALSRRKWDEADYLLGQLPDGWLRGNSARLFRGAVKEESGRTLELLFAHKLQRWLPKQELTALVHRVEAQRSPAKSATLEKAGLLNTGRMPASTQP